jgi:methyl-accepting chemotaxis protein
MSKGLTLGMKIGLGFATLVVISVALGGLAVWNMSSVEKGANTLAKAYVPAVGVANEVERDSLHTMYSARGYAFTEEAQFLADTKTNLGKVAAALEKAKQHADAQNLPVLKENVLKAEAGVQEYEKLFLATVATTEELSQDKERMNETAGKYMQICADYLKSQNEQLGQEFKTVAQAAAASNGEQAETIEKKLAERAHKVALANDVVDIGNAIRIGAWKAIATRDPALFQESMKKLSVVNQKLDELKAITKLEVNLKQIEDCRAAGQAYVAGMQSFLENWKAREELNKTRNVAANKVLEAAQGTSAANMEKTNSVAEDAVNSLSTAATVMLIGLGAAALLGCLLGFFITRSITKPINRIVQTLTEGSLMVAEASNQVNASATSLAEGASEQASSLEETSSALEEMASMTRNNAENAKQANQLVQTTHDAAKRSEAAKGQLDSAMTGINESSAQISKIIKVIEEIAFQTNLLALNAAVEAARAGEHGKGFAVVAEEVRNLAQRAAEAARETTGLIDTSVARAREGTEVAKGFGQAIGIIVENVSKISNLVSGITQASEEQSRGVDQINVAVGEMDKVTQQIAASSEESASAVEELSAQASTVADQSKDLAKVVGTQIDRIDRQHAADTVHQNIERRRTSKHDLPTVKSGGKKSPKPVTDNHQGSQDFSGLDGF